MLNNSFEGAVGMREIHKFPFLGLFLIWMHIAFTCGFGSSSIND
jgi:hypothetical protein